MYGFKQNKKAPRMTLGGAVNIAKEDSLKLKDKLEGTYSKAKKCKLKY